jgi:hypothetical protein
MSEIQGDQLILVIYCIGLVVAFALGFLKGGQS